MNAESGCPVLCLDPDDGAWCHECLILPSVAFSGFCSGYFILLGVTQIWPHSIFGISNLIARRTYVHTA